MFCAICKADLQNNSYRYCNLCNKLYMDCYHQYEKINRGPYLTIYAAVDLTEASNILCCGTIEDIVRFSGLTKSAILSSISDNFDGTRRGYKFIKIGKDVSIADKVRRQLDIEVH